VAVTLNRPERHNAWTFELAQALFDLADRADADQRIGAIVLSGAEELLPRHGHVGSGHARPGPGVAARRRPPTHLRSMRKLTVAAINGGCASVGFVQALRCDVPFAAEEAKLSCSFTRRDAPAEYGASWLLPRLIGLADATDLLLSGRTIDAAEGSS
jgi:enoyl-CoA hydratase/carnithine racemase